MAKMKRAAAPRKDPIDDAAERFASAIAIWARANPDEAPGELARAIAALANRFEAETKRRPPEAVLGAAQALLDVTTDKAVSPVATSSRVVTAAEGLATDGELSASLRRGRHDEKRVRGGRTFRDGMLLEPATGTLRAPTERAQRLIDWIVRRLSRWKEQWLTNGQEEQLERILEVLQPPVTWETVLVQQLEWDEHHREEARLQAELGVPPPAGSYLLDDPERPGQLAPSEDAGATCGPATGGQILAHIQMRARAHGFQVPDQLTAQVIERMRERSGKGGGGPGDSSKRKPKNLVEDFVRALRRGRSA